ncbi:hypothetical protein [Herbaspirillum sp. NPDC087042]|uniref:hypothetical protein n=1 Tax=Herbaspirillum sp. NPDC087042 TaxID=3364004 RepID=UPI00380CA7D7
MLRAKILLLWLLTLAIPIQGFAAVLQACAPAMAQAAQVQPVQPVQPVQQHRMDTMAPMDHGMSADAHAHHGHHDTVPMSVAAGDDGSPAHHGQHHANLSCSFCAACTVGALLPLALATPPAPELPSREYLVQPTAGFVGYLPENPDRPPALA